MAILSQYRFDAASQDAQVVASNVTAGTIIPSPTHTSATITNEGYATDPIMRLASPAGSLNAAKTDGEYVEWTLQANSGFELSLDTFEFNVGRGGSSEIRELFFLSSHDNFTNSIFTVEPASVRPNFDSFSVDLTGIAAFQNTGSLLTFRIYCAARKNNRSLEFDDLTFNGTVASIASDATSVYSGGSVRDYFVKESGVWRRLQTKTGGSFV